MAYLIRCRVCNAYISSDAKFCPYCGDSNVAESVRVDKRKKAEHERKMRELAEKRRQEEEMRKRKEEEIKNAEIYFDNLPVKTRRVKEQIEFSANTFFGILEQKTVYDLAYKEAIIETYKDMYSGEKKLNYIIMVFDKNTKYFKYRYVSEKEFIAYGGKPLSGWEKFWL